MRSDYLLLATRVCVSCLLYNARYAALLPHTSCSGRQGEQVGGTHEGFGTDGDCQAEEEVDVEGIHGEAGTQYTVHVWCSGRSRQYFRRYLPLLALSREVGREQLCKAGTLRPETNAPCSGSRHTKHLSACLTGGRLPRKEGSEATLLTQTPCPLPLTPPPMRHARALSHIKAMRKRNAAQ